jgi:hypothetical protein
VTLTFNFNYIILIRILAQCSANWAMLSGLFEYVIPIHRETTIEYSSHSAINCFETSARTLIGIQI